MMALMSSSRMGKCSSLRLRPHKQKASRQRMPEVSSCRPLRMVTRLQPSSLSASRCAPEPRSWTVRAIKRRRSLPWREAAVRRAYCLKVSVNSMTKLLLGSGQQKAFYGIFLFLESPYPKSVGFEPCPTVNDIAYDTKSSGRLSISGLYVESQTLAHLPQGNEARCQE